MTPETSSIYSPNKNNNNNQLGAGRLRTDYFVLFLCCDIIPAVHQALRLLFFYRVGVLVVLNLTFYILYISICLAYSCEVLFYKKAMFQDFL